MRDQVVARVIGGMLFPFIIIFALYVQAHGEIGPGGGFQAGVILACAFILYSLLNGEEATTSLLPPRLVDSAMALGVLLYVGVGIHGLAFGNGFLDYSALSPLHPGHAEVIGITLVEAGIGLTVASVMLTLYRKLFALEES
ncbi:MAG TPA: Na(+)/H(+) antiporter subunit B [Planctomycetes bacterium]|nr:Na(+)/H(+) antiporter subunit B [Planctomycetota bacterium]HIN80651.1 Na(+)/H(+) antiporter subunit B [Planctomycetota bacterium]